MQHFLGRRCSRFALVASHDSDENADVLCCIRFGGGTRGKSGIAHDDDALEGTVNSSRQVGSGGEAGGEGRETAAAVGAKVSLRQYEDGHYRHLNRHDDERDMGSEDEAEYENEEFDDDDDDDDAFHDGQLEGGDEHDARSGDAGADGGLRSDRGGVARDGYYGGGGRCKNGYY